MGLYAASLSMRSRNLTQDMEILKDMDKSVPTLKKPAIKSKSKTTPKKAKPAAKKSKKK